MIARRAQLKASYQSQCHLAEKSMPNDFFATLYGLQLIVCSAVDKTLKKVQFRKSSNGLQICGVVTLEFAKKSADFATKIVIFTIAISAD